MIQYHLNTWLRTDGEWEVALALLHHMLSMSHQPDGRILGSVVNCLRTKARNLSRDLLVVRFVTFVRETWVVFEVDELAWGGDRLHIAHLRTRSIA